MEPERSNQPALPIDFENTEHDLFIKCGNLRLAKRGNPGTPHAGTWISLKAGWSFLDSADGRDITITLRGAGACSLRFVKPTPFPRSDTANRVPEALS
jgi:hypothetical protein